MWDQVVKKKLQNNLYLQRLSEFILSHMKPRHSNPIKRLGIPRDSIREASCWAWQGFWVTGVALSCLSHQQWEAGAISAASRWLPWERVREDPWTAKLRAGRVGLGVLLVELCREDQDCRDRKEVSLHRVLSTCCCVCAHAGCRGVSTSPAVLSYGRLYFITGLDREPVFFVVCFLPNLEACRILTPKPGLEPRPLHWKVESSFQGPGESQDQELVPEAVEAVSIHWIHRHFWFLLNRLRWCCKCNHCTQNHPSRKATGSCSSWLFLGFHVCSGSSAISEHLFTFTECIW